MDLKTQFKSSDWNPWVDEAFESIKGSLTDEQIARIKGHDPRRLQTTLW